MSANYAAGRKGLAGGTGCHIPVRNASTTSASSRNKTSTAHLLQQWANGSRDFRDDSHLSGLCRIADRAPYLHGSSPTPRGDLLRFIQGGGDVQRDLTGGFVVASLRRWTALPRCPSFLSALLPTMPYRRRGTWSAGANAFEVAAVPAWQLVERTHHCSAWRCTAI